MGLVVVNLDTYRDELIAAMTPRRRMVTFHMVRCKQCPGERSFAVLWVWDDGALSVAWGKDGPEIFALPILTNGLRLKCRNRHDVQVTQQRLEREAANLEPLADYLVP